MKTYKLYTIQLKELLNKVNNGDFVVDFEKNYDDIVCNVTNTSNNAFIYQLSKLYDLKQLNEDSFLDDLLLVDFAGITLKNNPKIRKLFENHGFTFTNINGKLVKYIPYDKSSSMSKASRMYFINENLKKPLDARLLLDFKFDKRCKIIPSKYLSYRGLYLTDGIRINSVDLSEKTVVVIDDEKVSPKEKHTIFTATKNKKEYIFKTINDYYFTEDQFTNYDGEGFISFEYADKINEELGCDASSYQIRMPFMKGMLHSVDFKDFINTYNTDKVEKITIKDVFGYERNLDDVQIILTKSMFKCYYWLKELLKNEDYKKDYINYVHDEEYDIMKYFFKKVKEYDHALYIKGLNVSLDNKNRTKKTTLNDQFLSTLKLDKKGFNNIMTSSINQIKNIEDNFILNDEEECYLESEDIYKRVITLNRNFLKEDKIKAIINSLRESYARNIPLGEVLTDGQCCILSSDLLSLLVHVFNQTNLKPHSSNYLIKNNQFIKENHFYMPNSYIELDEDKYYGILRSPHLSRSEEVLAKPYKIKENSLMEKYFSHLKGVLMVSKCSVLPLTLGGADYDGDLVKLYSNDEIVKAIKEGNYDNQYKRVSPIIVIPKDDSKYFEDLDYISYKTISSTFSNQIGLISMMSIQYGELANIIDIDPGYQRKCSIVAGMEVDASKTGNHPMALIESLKSEYEDEIKNIAKDLNIKFSESIDSNFNSRLALIRSISTYYWHRNKQFKDLLPYKYSLLETNNEYSLNVKGKKYDLKKPSIHSTNLYDLPYYFKDAYKEYRNNLYDRQMDGILFTFEDNPTWKNTLDTDKCKEIEKLIKAYKQVYSRSQTTVIGSDALNKAMAYILSTLQSMYCLILEEYQEFDIKYALDKTINYLIKYDDLKEKSDIIDVYERLKTEDLDNDIRLLLFNENYNENDNPIALFKYIVKYVLEKRKLDFNFVSTKDDNKYQKCFNDIFANACLKKLEKKTWSHELNLKAKEFLDNILDSNDNSVEYVYSLRKFDTTNKDFFWNILDDKSIINNIKKI